MWLDVDAGCEDGWVKSRLRCYKFVRDPPERFYSASRACRRLNARLVIIDAAEEDSFLKEHLAGAFPDTERWRTDGVRLEYRAKSNLVWYMAGVGQHEGM